MAPGPLDLDSESLVEILLDLASRHEETQGESLGYCSSKEQNFETLEQNSSSGYHSSCG